MKIATFCAAVLTLATSTEVVSFCPLKSKAIYFSAATTTSVSSKGKWTGPDWVENDVDVDSMTKEGNKKKKSDDWLAQFFNSFGQHKKEEEIQTRTTVNTESKISKSAVVNEMEEKKDAWIERDLKKASMAENEHVDRTAEDMNKVGKMGSPHDQRDWVRDDMLRAGQGGSNTPSKLNSKSEISKKNDAVAKDMTKTGKSSSSWVAEDMKRAGAPNAESQVPESSWMRQMDKAMEDSRGFPKYKDVQDDMKKAGSAGGESPYQVKMRMEKAGKAESPMDKLANFMNDVTKQISEWQGWQLKSLDKDELAKDMIAAGRGQDEEWIEHDMKTTGSTSSVGSRPIPTQEMHIREELTESEHTKWVSKDMREGGTAGPHSSHTNRMTRRQRDNLVAEDLNKVGRDAGYEAIQHDMEEAGHAQSQSTRSWDSNMNKVENRHYQFELEEFQHTKHTKQDMPKSDHKPTSWDVPAKDKARAVEETEETDEPNLVLRFMDKIIAPSAKQGDSPVKKTADDIEETSEVQKENLALHVLKKIVMPWKNWGAL